MKKDDPCFSLHESNRLIFIVHGFNMRKDTGEIILCSVDHTVLYHSSKTQHFRSIQETLLNLGGYNNNPSIVSARINALNFKDQHPLDKLGWRLILKGYYLSNGSNGLDLKISLVRNQPLRSLQF